jgi:hypothetical protein
MLRHDDDSPSNMLVPVGDTFYSVCIVKGPITIGGETYASFCFHDRREIHVDEIIPSDERWRVACVAVARATAALRRFHPIPVSCSVNQ